MNNDDNVNDVEPQPTPNAPPTDTSGKPVNVVERDLEDRDRDAKEAELTITPSSPRTKEQDAEALSQKIAEIERKVADGN